MRRTQVARQNSLYRMNQIEQQRSDDLRWALAAPEVQNHNGKFVVVYKKHVMAVGKNPQKARQRAARKASCREDHLVVVAVPSFPLSEIPH